MGLLSRFRRTGPATLRGSGNADEEHLRSWAGAHEGVEAFVEPRTTVTDTTVVFVAKEGE